MTIYLISFLALLVGLSYLFLIRFFVARWEDISLWEIPADFKPKTSISILLPARNEEQQISSCLDLLLSQQYPSDLLEVILIDDHSTDQTLANAHTFQHPSLIVLSLPEEQQGKKAALTYGIKQAQGQLIITTDADCQVPPDWVAYHASFFEATNAAFMAAPVQFFKERNALERFQSLDMLGTMLITGAGIQSGAIHMSNGANLAYPKSIFQAVGGFSGIDQLASGDDMLLMHKIAEAYPGQIGFLKNAKAGVRTRAVADWRAFFQQRLRWATKSGTYQDWRIIAVLAMVFFLCWGIILSPLLSIVYGWIGLLPFFLLFFSKILADYQLLNRATHFFNRKDLMQHFFKSQCLHIGYMAVIGLLANVFKQYEWKGRKLR